MKTPHKTSFTSLHVFEDVYQDFKKKSVINGISLQKLANRCMHMYITDPQFRQKVEAYNALQISGSSF